MRHLMIIAALVAAACDPHPPAEPESIAECVRRVNDRAACDAPDVTSPTSLCGEDPRGYSFELHGPGCAEAVDYCATPGRVECEEAATCRCDALAARGAIAWEWWGVCVSEARRRCDPHFGAVDTAGSVAR